MTGKDGPRWSKSFIAAIMRMARRLMDHNDKEVRAQLSEQREGLMRDLIAKEDEPVATPEPYLVCTCGDFRDSGIQDEQRLLYKCANCGGWMAASRYFDKRKGGEPNGDEHQHVG